jgi:hypothetical protein
MLELILTGGQTGADQAGWRAARACGLKTGSHMPPRFQTLTGPRPDFAELYGAEAIQECGKRISDVEGMKLRTSLNVQTSDATLVFNRGDADSPGTALAKKLCLKHGKPHMIVDPEQAPPPLYIAGRIANSGHKILNCAGNRAPDPDHWVESYLVQVFAMLVLNGLAVADPPWPGVEAVLCEMSRMAGPAAAAAALRGDHKVRPR